jgi:chain length determinant protein tyrosine kinase EpsG
MKPSENIVSMDAGGRLVPRENGRLGGILVADGKLGEGDIDLVLELQRVRGIRFGEAAVRLRMITAEDLRGAIAKQYGQHYLPPGSPGISSELVGAYNPFHPRAEELRALRTQLLIRWANARVNHRMLAIVVNRRSRSYLAANLAVVFSQLGQRTLLIDADLRNATAPHLRRAGQDSLSAVLSGRADRGAVVPLPQFAPCRCCRPVRARPTAGAAAAAGATSAGGIAPAFDVILFDTPPATLSADALSLAFRAGSAIVLARKDHTGTAAATNTIRSLTDTGTNVVGTVFNAF